MGMVTLYLAEPRQMRVGWGGLSSWLSPAPFLWKEAQPHFKAA